MKMFCLTCMDKGIHSTDVIAVDVPGLLEKKTENLIVCSACHSRGQITKVTCRTFKRLSNPQA